MDYTPTHRLPLMAPAQAAKHIVHNEALLHLDRIVHLSVESRTVADPPDADEGARFLVGSPATNAWAGWENRIAVRSGGAWERIDPQPGWPIWIADEARAVIWTDSGGTPLRTGDDPEQTPDQLGINTGADAVNRLSVKTDAALFSHDDVTPGTGGVQIKLNKKATGDTASLLFQTGYEGRAEIGTAGNDALSVKVTDDGANWKTALEVDGASGAVSLPRTPQWTAPINAFPDAGRFADLPFASAYTSQGFKRPSYLVTRNGSVLSDGGKCSYNSATFGGSGPAVNADVQALVEALHDTSLVQRNAAEFHALLCQAGSQPTDSPTDHGGTSYYRCFTNGQTPLPARFTLRFHLRVKTGSVLIRQTADSVFYRDGVRQGADLVIAPADGWVCLTRHFSLDPRTQIGFNGELFNLLSSAGATLLIALPVASIGHAPTEPGGMVPTVSGWV
ncbi:MAG: DUF2793 domain-containing protein [Litorimonas sp.]